MHTHSTAKRARIYACGSLAAQSGAYMRILSQLLYSRVDRVMVAAFFRLVFFRTDNILLVCNVARLKSFSVSAVCLIENMVCVCIRASNNSRTRTNNKKNLRRSAKFSFFILFACAILHGKKNSPHIGTKRTENERKKRNVRFVCCIWEIKMQWIFLQLSIYYYTANETKIDDTHCIRRRIAYLNTGWFIREKTGARVECNWSVHDDKFA